MTMVYTHERIRRYVEKVFAASGNTEFPTVRQVAKALRVRQSVVEDEVEGCPDANMQLTSFFCYPPEKLGDHFVEIF